jgi:hypothetical protein
MVIAVPNLKATRISRDMLILTQIERASRNLIAIIYNSGSAEEPKETLVLNAGMALRKFPFPYQSYSTMGSNVGLDNELETKF